MCEETSPSATSPESISAIAEAETLMGIHSYDKSMPPAMPTTMAHMQPEPLSSLQQVPDLASESSKAMLETDDDAAGANSIGIGMSVQTPWDNLDATSTSAYPIKTISIDPLGSSHTHFFGRSADNVPSAGSSSARSADQFAVLGMHPGYEHDDGSNSDDGRSSSSSSSSNATGEHSMDEDEDEDNRRMPAVGVVAAAAVASASQAAGGGKAGAAAAAATAAAAIAATTAAQQKKQAKLAAKQEAAMAAAKARTGPPPAIPTSRDIAAFDPKKVIALDGGPPDAVLYSHAHNDSTRPPYSYTALIYYAIHAIGKDRVQLGEVYYQIMASWKYYASRPLETGWKNSIRHNLTVCRCFKKVARAEGESGKGGYWVIDEPFAKIDIQLDPRDASPRLARKGKPKKKSKSQALADKREKPMPYSSTASPKVSRRSAASPAALEAAAAASLSSSSGSSEGLPPSEGAGAAVTMPAPNSASAAAKTSTQKDKRRSMATKAAAIALAAEETLVYPAHLLAGFDEPAVDEFAPREHDEKGNPLPDIPRGPGHTTRVVLHGASGLEESFSALAGMSVSLSSSFSNALLGSSLGGANVLSQSFSNLLAGGHALEQ